MVEAVCANDFFVSYQLMMAGNTVIREKKPEKIF
jgi:hypothetical protein